MASPISGDAWAQSTGEESITKGARLVFEDYLRAFGQGERLEWEDLVQGHGLSGLDIIPEPAPMTAGRPEKLAYFEPLDEGAGVTAITVTGEVVQPETKRFGVNLSAPTSYESALFMSNIFENPGFENGLFGMVFHVDENATGARLPMAFWDPAWNNESLSIGHPEGYWDGAEYEIVYGPAKGRSGRVTQFRHENNRNIFYLDGSGTVPRLWDVAFVRTEVAGTNARADRTTVRPGSPGTQSMKMAYPGDPWRQAYSQYWDTLARHADPTAGKLFLVKGAWRLSFWAKSDVPGAQLQAKFARSGEVTFLDSTFTLSTSWTRFEKTFSVPNGVDRLTGYTEANPPPFLTFGLHILNPGTVWVDDIELCRSDQRNPTAFADSLVDRLMELRPGIIRDWSTQLGNTLDNELAPPFARKTHDFRPRLRRCGLYSYSLHEFLELCHYVEAEPWYVVPPTFSLADMANLAAYLGAPVESGHPYALKRAALGRHAPWTTVFPQIHLEYGNEMWGAASGSDPFMGASALGGERLGRIAHDRFQVMKGSPYFRDDIMHLVIGGQASYPGRQTEIDNNSANHKEIAIAPYFGIVKDAWTTDEQLFYPLFAKAYHDVRVGKPRQSRTGLGLNGKNTSLGVYEINFHTTGGAPSTNVLNDFMTSGAGGLALPLYMLLYQRELGIVNQCAFTALQYSIMGQGYVRIWGTLRDIEATGRKRPTWLGMELANFAIRGEMVRTVTEGAPTIIQYPINGLPEATEMPLIESFAFRDGDSNSVYITNLSASESRHIQLNLPFGSGGFASCHKLLSPTMRSDNEDAEQVRITQELITDFESPYEFVLPAHSAYVFRWAQSGNIPSLGVPWWEER